ncbi:MAG: peptide chain release factor 2 [Phycisphaerales bacterium]|nr:peptide chain release factor 2 [Phycisphaerales bacterium]
MRCGTLFDWPNKQEQLNAIQGKMSVQGFWDNGEAARETVAELKRLRGVLDPMEAAAAKLEDLKAIAELLRESDDEDVRVELLKGVADLTKAMDGIELLNLLSGENDIRNCYFNIQAGTGGADACDWAQMLLRMYLRYFERNRYEVEELSMREGEEAGIQSCSLLVKAPYAYGRLSCETGVHRLVRISPFSAQGKRETSFASVDVQPEIDDIEVEVDWDKDVREDTYRAGGKGGQHVNKTASAVRLTHLATGLVAQCQSERSQHKNRASAQKMLMARLYQLEQSKRDAELSKIYGEKGQISWGNAIRSYFLHPEQRVKDTRTGVMVGDSQSVLDGEIDEFIDAYLRKRAAARTA